MEVRLLLRRLQRIWFPRPTCDVSCLPDYRCSSCSRCYLHQHRSYCLFGVWFWRHPVRVNRKVVFDASIAYPEPDVVYW